MASGSTSAESQAVLSEDEQLLTVPDLARMLRLTNKGVYALVSARRIPFVRISNRVRFLRQDVILWLRKNRVPAEERGKWRHDG